jgi:glycosyltransferase involved in cell wall biosynthesis
MSVSTMEVRSHASLAIDRHMEERRVPVRTALLTNFIPPYFLPVLRILQDSVDSLRVFLSTPMENDRPWASAWDGVDVVVQRSIATRHKRSFQVGFSETIVRHFPYDTLPQLHRYRPDVIVSAQLGFRTVQAAVYRQLHPSCRLVIWADLSQHTEREVGAVQRQVRRSLLARADAVVVSGRSGLEYIQGLGVPADRIVIAPYVTDSSSLPRPPFPRDTRVARRFLFVGQLIERKGLEPFLRALAQWASEHTEEKCEMWLVGDGPLRNSLERVPVPPNLALNFFGNVPYNETRDFYLRAGIFVLPTLSDTWGLVINEALAAGLPILGSRYSQAVQELVTDGVNGWTFHADRPGEVMDALKRALSCSLPQLAEMSKNSKRISGNLTPAYSASCFARAIKIASAPGLGSGVATHE